MRRTTWTGCAILGLLGACGGGGGGSGAQSFVTLLSPNGGETWEEGTTQIVTWDVGAFAGPMDIDISTNGGATWSALEGFTPNDGTEDVVVPSSPTSSARLRIGAADGNPAVATLPADASDGIFTIVAAFGVTSPNGGETWSVGFGATVIWNPGTFAGNVDIDISTDGGTTWSALVTATANDGGQVVAVPATPSTTVRIQVSAADGNPSVAAPPADSSDANFTIQSPFADIGAGLVGVGEPSPFGGPATVAWGDYDNDGDLDLAIAGRAGSPIFAAVTRIYRNGGGGVFTDIVAGLPGVGQDGGAALAWGDFDNDGDLDLAIAGQAGSPIFAAITRVYRNTGGVFTDVGAGLLGVGQNSPSGSGCSIAWGDYDGDGDLDLAVAGRAGTPVFAAVTIVYRNDGGGVFTDAGAGIQGIGNNGAAAIAWGDYDNDGDLDLAITGAAGSPIFADITRIYRNDGAGVFSDVGAGLPGTGVLGGSAIAWGDFDGDGDLDLALAGRSGAPLFASITRVYRNDGGTFVDVAAGIIGVGDGGPGGGGCALAWGDVDGDGDLDLAIAGRAGSPLFTAVTRVYRNDGGGVFSDMQAGLPGVGETSGGAALALGDFDDDGRLDLLLAGRTGSPAFAAITRIYRNRGAVPSDPPSAPANVEAFSAGGQVLLTWDPATDDTTVSPTLTYNLRIGHTTTDDSFYASMASGTGLRRIPAMGPVVHNPVSVSALVSLPPGVYFASVQAIDATFQGGPWSAPIVVTVP